MAASNYSGEEMYGDTSGRGIRGAAEVALNISIPGELEYVRSLESSVRTGTLTVAPRALSLGIVSECGSSRCGYCTNWRGSSHVALALAEITSIIDDAQTLGVQQVLFSGGEPLYHPQIFDAMEYARSRELDVLLITNGLLLDEVAISRLAEVGCKKIGVSFDSLSDARYKRIRGTERAPLTAAIALLTAALQRSPGSLNISLCMTLHRENYDEMTQIVDFGLERGFAVQFQPYQRDSDTKQSILRRFWPNEAEIDAIEGSLQYVISLKQQGRAIANRLEYLQAIPDYFRTGNFHPAACYAPFAQITIDEHGGLRPCWQMGSVGVVRGKRSLLRLWDSPQMNQQRHAAATTTCPGCMYSCHLSKSYIPFPTPSRPMA